MATPSGARTGLIFILAIGFGIVAAVLSMLYLKSREAAIVASLAGEEDQMVAVVVAKQDLAKGQKIATQDFAVREIPSSYVHPNAIPPTQFSGYAGRFLVTDIARGKPLLTSFLDETFPVDFSDLVKKGRRAMTIQIDEPQAIAGMLRPGNHIDLYVNIGTKTVAYNAPDLSGLQDLALQGAELQEVAAAAGGDLLERVSTGRANDVIIPVLQDVMVLATGREAYEDHLDELGQPQRRRTSSFSTVTLDLSPTQAAILAIAEDKGDLIGVLRNRSDRGAAEFTGVTALDLLAHVKKMKKEMAMREAAQAAGATIDENGNWVTADGKVINKDDIVISENGTVSTKDGSTLAAVGKDGKIVSGDEALRQAAEAAGATIDENGNWVT
ncbi:MAG TPA: Flp pilus assembly protein CpaB, partial [Gammaproteobacteria bacterium]|nr:Flp pilus assembly protein CpaB [Gammaproteobacteria bacterium]